jgi:hypothetical protein
MMQVELSQMAAKLWGITFAPVEDVLPGLGWRRGILFSIGAWFA